MNKDQSDLLHQLLFKSNEESFYPTAGSSLSPALTDAMKIDYEVNQHF